LSGIWNGVLSLYEQRDGIRTGDGEHVVYDVSRNEAHFGAADVAGRALRFELTAGAPDPGALLSCPVALDASEPWIVRCDRIDFPPGGIAYTHTHPGPGIRYLLVGTILIRSEGHETTYAPGEPWFEAGPEPVHATAALDRASAFVRVLLLPAVWEGKRTIRYEDPADEAKPKLQRPTVFFDHPIALR
jgi:quercetin dioxygenase-like cupin family protein